jgi:hypothetical protein
MCGRELDTEFGRTTQGGTELSKEHAIPPLDPSLRQILETLLTGDLVFPKTVDGDAKKVRSLLVAMSIDGLVSWTEEQNEWVFKITDEGRAALTK